MRGILKSHTSLNSHAGMKTHFFAPKQQLFPAHSRNQTIARHHSCSTLRLTAHPTGLVWCSPHTHIIWCQPQPQYINCMCACKYFCRPVCVCSPFFFFFALICFSLRRKSGRPPVRGMVVGSVTHERVELKDLKS